jgi:uncharacterized phage protein gp47/JayE
VFSIKTFEQLTTRMIEWFKGNTSQITDFSIGSKARTMIEAVAMVVEELYYFVWEAIKVRLEESIYLAFDFPLRPARRATGYATFSRTTPAGQDYLIPVGTMIATEATDYNPEIQFETTTSVTLLTGETSVTIPIQARREGKLGNVAAGKIIIFFSKPSGVEAVTNQLALVDGRDLETRDERKQRFREYIASRWRATKQALQYGAMEVPGVTAAKAIETPKTYALIWDTVTYFDVTSPANDPYEVSVDLIPAAETVGSCLYLGAISKFNFLYVNMTRVGVGSAGRWEYWTGTEWKAIQMYLTAPTA